MRRILLLMRRIKANTRRIKPLTRQIKPLTRQIRPLIRRIKATIQRIQALMRHIKGIIHRVKSRMRRIKSANRPIPRSIERKTRENAPRLRIAGRFCGNQRRAMKRKSSATARPTSLFRARRLRRLLWRFARLVAHCLDQTRIEIKRLRLADFGFVQVGMCRIKQKIGFPRHDHAGDS